MRLLLVDDNQDILILLKRSFEQAGHTVSTASSGEQALAFVQSGTFDAIISDVLMPNGSGTWLVEQLQKHTPRIPVILITAGSDISRSQALALGASEFLKKPVDIFRLEEALERIAG